MIDQKRAGMRTAAAIVALALVAGLAAIGLTATPAAAACGATGTRTLTGSFTGEDGRTVSGFVGLSVFNSAGQNIGIDGCPITLTGYGPFTDLVNPHPSNPGCCFALPTEGAASGGERTWSIVVPNNATIVWVEAYPKSSTPNAQGQSHQTDYRRYGGAMRRGVSALGNGSHLDIRLPLNCASGGAGPTLVGTATRNGAPAQIYSVAAFSVAPEGTGKILGFGTTPIAVNGPTFTLPSLAPNQNYALEITTTDGGHWWFEHNYGTGVPVRSCAGSPVQATFELPGSGFGGDRAVLTGLTGGVASGPAAAATGSGTTNQVFYRGFNGALMTMTEGSTTQYDLGGRLLGEPDAVLSEPGRIDVVARGADNQVFWRTYTNAGGWTGWVPLAGSTGHPPAITSWGPGRLDVVATGLDGQLWLRSTANGGQSWFPWTPLGGSLTAGPDITTWGPGRLDIVARGGNGGVYHLYYSGRWSGWESLGGYVLGGPSNSSPTGNRLDIVARGGNGGVYTMRWNGSGYTGWTLLNSGFSDADPEVFSHNGRSFVYARGTNGALYRTNRTSPDASFGGWAEVLA